MDIKEIRGLTGLSQTKFAQMYKIPERTLEDWERGKSSPSKYLLELLERAVKEDFKDNKAINNKCYNHKSVHEMGYIYNALLHTINKNGDDPYPRAEVFPFQGVILMLTQASTTGIPRELEERIKQFIGQYSSNDIEYLMNTPCPIKYRNNWIVGYYEYDRNTKER